MTKTTTKDHNAPFSPFSLCTIMFLSFQRFLSYFPLMDIIRTKNDPDLFLNLFCTLVLLLLGFLLEMTPMLVQQMSVLRPQALLEWTWDIRVFSLDKI